MFEVQHHTLCDGWVNTWSVINADDTETPQRFNTREEAQLELNDYFADIQLEIESGERHEDEGYDRSEFRIVEV